MWRNRESTRGVLWIGICIVNFVSDFFLGSEETKCGFWGVRYRSKWSWDDGEYSGALNSWWGDSWKNGTFSERKISHRDSRNFQKIILSNVFLYTTRIIHQRCISWRSSQCHLPIQRSQVLWVHWERFNNCLKDLDANPNGRNCVLQRNSSANVHLLSTRYEQSNKP